LISSWNPVPTVKTRRSHRCFCFLTPHCLQVAYSFYKLLWEPILSISKHISHPTVIVMTWLFNPVKLSVPWGQEPCLPWSLLILSSEASMVEGISELFLSQINEWMNNKNNDTIFPILLAYMHCTRGVHCDNSE
jgi:hypothetical protein